MKFFILGLFILYACGCNAAASPNMIPHQGAHLGGHHGNGSMVLPQQVPTSPHVHENAHSGQQWHHGEYQHHGSSVVITIPFFVPGIYTAPNYYNYDENNINGYYDTNGEQYYIDSSGRPYYLDQYGVPYYVDPNGNYFRIDANGNAVY